MKSKVYKMNIYKWHLCPDNHSTSARKKQTVYSCYLREVFRAYYLLSDNETLIMISGIKSIRSNFKFNLKNNKLEKLPTDNNYKLFISSLLKDCSYRDINATYECSFYKPLISANLIN